MLRFLKWLLIILVALATVTSAFAFYTYFLVDYSLESLETALAATETSAPENSPAASNIYRTMIEDAALKEVISDKMNVKNLIMTETASRSFRESLDRNGYKHAQVYLNEVVKRKKTEQGIMLNFRDSLESYLRQASGFFKFFFKFFGKKLSGKKENSDLSAEGARFVFLSKIQKLEKEKKYKEAAERYRRYLKLYPGSSDRGFVTISLANILIKDGRVREAERLFKDVQSAYAGKIESRIASQGLAKILAMDKDSLKAEQLQQSIKSQAGGAARQSVEYELAMLYISLYRFPEAERILQSMSAEKTAVGAKANFYLGWIYKQNQEFDKAETAFVTALQRKELPDDLELGTHAQLADIYYQMKRPAQALKQYALLKEKSELNQEEAEDGVWKKVSAYEQANIYHYDLKDSERARQQMENFGEGSIEETSDSSFTDNFFEVAGSDMRARGFRALGSRQFGMAYELFNSQLSMNPNDAWAMAGLSTVSLMLGDLKDAVDYAEKAYLAQLDEYTASIMAYMYGVRRQYSVAEGLYDKALKMNPDYFPAQFNLACMLIRQRKYDRAEQLLMGMESIKSLSPLMMAKIYNNLGYLYWQKGSRKEALEKIEKAVKIEPNYTLALNNLKRLSLQTGQ